MRIAAVTLNDTIDLTLRSNDGEPGWRFGGWKRNDEEVVSVLPSAADCEREFSTIDEAIAYFRDHYGARLAAS